MKLYVLTARRVRRPARGLVVAALLAGCGGDSGTAAPGGEVMRVQRMTPAARDVSAAPGPVALSFDRPLWRESVVVGRTLHVFARASGNVRGGVSFADDDRTLVFTPARPFAAGEVVTVLLSRDVEGADGVRLGPGGFSAQFWTRAAAAPAAFTEIGRHSTRRLPALPSRAYGGVATDLDGDGDADLAIVNEDSFDLAVFLNRGGGAFASSGERFVLGRQASPSEAGDFDRDGVTDVAVANIADGTVTILLGRGNGGFRPPQLLRVGTEPRGIAALDVDGDADLDLATANFFSNDVTILVNDGGTFRVASRIESGLSGEWAIAAADMDEDGLLDLVVGSRTADGDGDLDWLTSSYSGDWRLFENRGGVLVMTQELAPREAASCALLFDADGDGDVDLALIDEEADEVILMRNGG